MIVEITFVEGSNPEKMTLCNVVAIVFDATYLRFFLINNDEYTIFISQVPLTKLVGKMYIEEKVYKVASIQITP